MTVLDIKEGTVLENFKVPVKFVKENFNAREPFECAATLTFFGIELLKIYLIDSNVSILENCKTVISYNMVQSLCKVYK